MKNRIFLLLCALLMCISCVSIAEETYPVCAAILVSDSVGGDFALLEQRRYLDAVLNGLEDAWRGIAYSIPDERIVDVHGGKELYLILPLDAEASVSVVYLSDEDESLIYHSETGEPLLLRCNAVNSPWEEDPYLSDFEEVAEPFDCRVCIEDSVGDAMIWNPYIHFYMGEMNTQAQGGYVIDFTNY